jgi:hypothetical protein
MTGGVVARGRLVPLFLLIAFAEEICASRFVFGAFFGDFGFVFGGPLGQHGGIALQFVAGEGSIIIVVAPRLLLEPVESGGRREVGERTLVIDPDAFGQIFVVDRLGGEPVMLGLKAAVGDRLHQLDPLGGRHVIHRNAVEF